MYYNSANLSGKNQWNWSASRPRGRRPHQYTTRVFNFYTGRSTEMCTKLITSAGSTNCCYLSIKKHLRHYIILLCLGNESKINVFSHLNLKKKKKFLIISIETCDINYNYISRVNKNNQVMFFFFFTGLVF